MHVSFCTLTSDFGSYLSLPIANPATLRLWDLDAGEVMKELMELWLSWYPVVASYPDPPKIFHNQPPSCWKLMSIVR